MSTGDARPEELHAAAPDVLTQLRRPSTAWRFELRPAVGEVDAVSATVAALHRQVASLDAADVGAEDRRELAGARDRLREAALLATRLLATMRASEDPGLDAGTG